MTELRVQRGLGARGDLRERRRIAHREVGEHLPVEVDLGLLEARHELVVREALLPGRRVDAEDPQPPKRPLLVLRSEEHTSELQSRQYLVCRLLLEKKK